VRSAALIVLSLLVGCAQILGIEAGVDAEAEDEGQGGGTTSAGGMAGSGAAAGMDATGGSTGDGGGGGEPCDSDPYYCAVMADSPLSYWRLGDDSGSMMAMDSGPNAAHGIYVGNPVLGAAPLVHNSDGLAVLFDDGGSNEYDWIDIPNMPIDRSPNEHYTLEAWVELFVDPVEGVHIVSLTGHIGLHLSANNRISRLRRGAQIIAGDRPAVGVASHIVGTYDGTDLCIYVDTVASCEPVSGSALTAPQYPLIIGATTSSGSNRFGYWPGILDEVAYYDYALSAARVAAHRSAGLP
jgi:hypothetical protein